jgi:hypothetical protein
LGFFGVMAGSVLGAALQLQQAALWDRAVYIGLLGVAAAGWAWLPRVRRLQRLLLPALLLAGALGGAGLAGWRASVRAADALDPALEGRDLQVVGVVSQMRSVAMARCAISSMWRRPGGRATREGMRRRACRCASRWAGTRTAPASGAARPIRPLARKRPKRQGRCMPASAGGCRCG